MKLIKRNGSEEIFDRQKIAAAITKANEAVDEDEQITKGKINITQRNLSYDLQSSKGRRNM